MPCCGCCSGGCSSNGCCGGGAHCGGAAGTCPAPPACPGGPNPPPGAAATGAAGGTAAGGGSSTPPSRTGPAGRASSGAAAPAAGNGAAAAAPAAGASAGGGAHAAALASVKMSRGPACGSRPCAGRFQHSTARRRAASRLSTCRQALAYPAHGAGAVPKMLSALGCAHAVPPSGRAATKLTTPPSTAQFSGCSISTPLRHMTFSTTTCRFAGSQQHAPGGASLGTCRASGCGPGGAQRAAPLVHLAACWAVGLELRHGPELHAKDAVRACEKEM